MSDLPEPLTPPDCDLQGMSFMPLHVTRLRDSDLAAIEEPEACWYAVLLWAASWHQIPAASIPDDDAVLARLVGLGRDVKTFRKHRAGALRGFVKCNDGRLYHPVVADEAVKAWTGRTEHRTERNANAERQARWRKEMAEICEKLRNLGVTPPAGAKKEALLTLLRDAEQHNVTNNADRNVRNVTTVTPVMAKTGTGTGTVPPTPKRVTPAEALPVADHLHRIMTEGRMISPPSDAKLITEWIALGATMDEDILPVVRRLSQSLIDRSGRGPFKLKVFDAAIREKLAEDAAAIERSRGNVERMRREEERQQREIAERDAEDARWQASQGRIGNA